MKKITKYKSLNGETYDSKSECEKMDIQTIKNCFSFDYSNQTTMETTYLREYSPHGDFIEYGVLEKTTIKNILKLIHNQLKDIK